MYNLERAIYHIKQADMWLEMYGREQTPTRRILLEHYIHLAKHHIAKAKEVVT